MTILRRLLRPTRPAAEAEEWDPVPSSERGWQAVLRVRDRAIAAQEPSAIRRYGPVLLLLVAMAACAHVQIGERNEPPAWRQPGPALLEPLPRLRAPEDGYRAEPVRRGAAGTGWA